MECKHYNRKKIHNFDYKALYLCNECGLIFTEIEKTFNPKSIYEKYYKKDISGRFNFGVECIVKLFRFVRACKIVKIYPKAKSILDIGSGRGFMLYYLKKYFKYHTAVGTQISQNALEFSKNKLKLEIYDKDLLKLNFSNKHFDIITILHVLEHIKKPEKYIEKIYSLLNTQGKLIVEVPNFNSWTRAFTGKYWLALDLDHHLTFFTPQSLIKLLKKYNFKIKRIRAFSLEYSTFTSAQSMLSLITKSNHIFFRFLQTGKFKPILTLHIFLFILLFPICFLINFLLYFSKKGEDLYIVAEK